MQYVYKRIKISVPHCPTCGEQLMGNNSIVMPYRCSCGTWHYDFSTEEFDVIKD